MRFMLGVAAGAAGTLAAMTGLGIAAAVLLTRKKPNWPEVKRDMRAEVPKGPGLKEMIEQSGTEMLSMVFDALEKSIGNSAARSRRHAAEEHLSSETAAELEELRKEAAKIVSDPDAWLNEPNVDFGLQTPADVIKDGRGHFVREKIQSIQHGMHS